jgi:serine kinase of HPr protein (carbohydrate metabolism regulator)
MIATHGTAVALGGLGVLLRGPSGSGKSDLALRLIAVGAQLVADDQVMLARIDDRVWMAPPAGIAGLLEVRGQGIRRVAHLHSACLALIGDLLPPEQIERLPEPARTPLLGIDIPVLQLAPFEASAAAKLALALENTVSGRGVADDSLPASGRYT